ncbi:MAG: type II toxin-antitoxin system HicB family antitoxin [Firmicutes bacterium]|nr:type II toxin-antitoxin system HicB family antitoxin [Bacillota bacterium]
MKTKDRYIYPAIFEPDSDNRYSVSFPDLPGCLTEEDTVEEALRMAQDALKLHLYGMEKDGDPIPAPSVPSSLEVDDSGFVSLVDVWMPAFRKSMEIKSVKKTLTIPKWLNDLAEREGVNFSYILQKSLKEYLREHSDEYLD